MITDKLDKTVIVKVISSKVNNRYHKSSKITKSFFVHDEHNKCKRNDIVIFTESRPLSKLKKWIVVKNKT